MINKEDMTKQNFTNKIATFFISVCILFINFGIILPAQAAGASLYLSPSSGTHIINGKFTIQVRLSTGGQVINASEGLINFDKDILEVASVSKSGSIFSLWTAEPSFSNSAGTISFGGGLPPPGFSGASGIVCSITFKAKKMGTGMARFSSGAILANDGKGTNILESMGSGNYTVAAAETVPKSTDEKKDSSKTEEKKGLETKEVEEYNKPLITSPTHPDQNKWYNNKNVEFKWELPDTVTGVSIMFNQEPVSDPGSKSDGIFTSKLYNDVESGTWYLHLKFNDGKRWGTVEHYRVLIDSLRPLPFTVKVEQSDKNDWPTMFFKAVDEESGIVYYEIYINSLDEKKYLLEDVEEMLNVKLSELEFGEHTALIKAVDKAGNETSSTLTFTIDPIESPELKNYPREFKSTDKLFISGSALPNASVSIFIQPENGNIITKIAQSDKDGNWFLIYDENLPNGRYIAWAEVANENGLKSKSSSKISFLVTPPVFARIGSFVINYFTVFVSLLFMIILIIVSLLYIASVIRKKLKKETLEVEQVLQKNMAILKKIVESEIGKLNKINKSPELAKERLKMKKMLEDNIKTTEKKILDEINDVEDILR